MANIVSVVILCYCTLAVPIHGQLLKATNRRIAGFGKADQGRWEGPYVFVQGTDPQPGFIDLINGGNGTKWDEEIRLLKETVDAVNNMTSKPGFFMITGDIVDAYPGVEPYRTQQTQDVLSCLEKLKVPTMVISGNHDLLNIPTRSTIEEFRNQYGDDYYTFYYGGVMYIALNSQYFYNSSLVEEGAQDQMDWLDIELHRAKSDVDLKHVVVFMHIPLFLNEGDEADDAYFNIRSPLRQKLMNDFMEARIKTVFSGHYHRNAGGIFDVLIDGRNVSIESVVTSAIGAQLGEDKSGLRIVNVEDDQINHKYYALEDVPTGPALCRGISSLTQHILALVCDFLFHYHGRVVDVCTPCNLLS